MKYVYYELNEQQRLGVLKNDRVTPFRELHGITRDTTTEVLKNAQLDNTSSVSLDDIRLLPPSNAPAKVICVGLNYKAHVNETGRELPTYPVFFPKFASNLIGASDDIVLPSEVEAPDFEGEMAVVIGKSGRYISRDNAMDHILGYSVSNDISMRDYQYKSHQWMQGKAWDDSTPLGPVIVTTDEIDPTTSTIRTQLNGETVQESTLEHLIFSVPELIETISQFTVLEPGDVILTGTPSGIGYTRDPRLILKAGDVLSVEVEGVGIVENRCIADVR